MDKKTDDFYLKQGFIYRKGKLAIYFDVISIGKIYSF